MLKKKCLIKSGFKACPNKIVLLIYTSLKYQYNIRIKATACVTTWSVQVFYWKELPTGKIVFNVYFLPFVVSEMLFSKAYIRSPLIWWGFRTQAGLRVILNWVSSSRKLLSPERIVKGICLGRCSSRRPAYIETNDKCWTEFYLVGFCELFVRHIFIGKLSTATYLHCYGPVHIIPLWKAFFQ